MAQASDNHEGDAVETARARQAEMYGEPLNALVGRVSSGLGLTQRQVADVLGLSAPMLSQLVGGRRVKIGNPAVVSRLGSLLDLAERAPGMTREALTEALDDVRAARPTLTSSAGTAQVSGGAAASSDTRGAALAELRGLATSEQLAAVATLCGPAAPQLAALLREAAGQ